MDKYLDKIQSIEDFKKIPKKDLNILCTEIREFLIKSVSKTGGHLSSNLGIVELTVALHKVFNSPIDKIIFDVSHQSYVHKIITGRKEGFKNLKSKNGMSGFTSKRESMHDIFDIGHTSTSISNGLGLAIARDMKKEKFNVISIIGDGALTGGEAFESLNNLANYKGNLIVILNDNDMSISKNTGGISNHLKNIDKENNIFTMLGLKYIGIIDGHDINKLIETFESLKDINMPVIVHVKTLKGKGYNNAEKNPVKYHASGKFDIEKGLVENLDSRTYTKAAAVTIEKILEKEDIAVICPAMQHSLQLENIEEKYKNNFFDTAIAEQHAISFAAGLARNNIKPYVFMYSTFLQRAYDQIEQDVCLNNLPVKILIDRAGIVGEDGKTHQGIYDISFLSHIPNLILMSPKDDIELVNMINYANNLEKPLAIRYPKGKVENIKIEKYEKIKTGKMELVNNGEKIAILGLGNMYSLAEEVYLSLKEKGNNITLINPRFVSPLDNETLDKLKDNHELVITIEDGILEGGFAEKIARYFGNDNIKTKHYGFPKDFIMHASKKDLYEKYNITKENIIKEIEGFLV